MPKIIEGIEEKVVRVSSKLFTSEFYLDVDARRIAKEVGVSVGTLYNYFPTKQDIFLAVVDKKFEKVEKELAKELLGESSFEEKMYGYISKLYQLTERAKKLHRSLTYLFIIEDEVVLKHSKNVHQRFQELMRKTIYSSILENYPGITEEEIRRLLTVIRSSTLFFIRYSKGKSEEKQKDIDILYEIVINLLKNRIEKVRSSKDE